MNKEQRDRGIPSIFSSLLWTLLCLAIWLWTLVGPLRVLVGAVSYFVDLLDFLSNPRSEAFVLDVVLLAVGDRFIWLRMRRVIKFRGE
jgi:hypothetical protein